MITSSAQGGVFYIHRVVVLPSRVFFAYHIHAAYGIRRLQKGVSEYHVPKGSATLQLSGLSMYFYRVPIVYGLHVYGRRASKGRMSVYRADDNMVVVHVTKE